MKKMNNGSILYRAELRKIFDRKAVWVGLLVGLCFVLLVGFTNLSADGHRAYIKRQSENLVARSGEKLDGDFLEAFRQRVETELESNPERYESLYAYDPGAAWENAAGAIGEKDLYDLIVGVLRDREAMPEVTGESFYAKLRENIEQDSRDLGASEEELDSWLAVYDGVEKPITYSYALSYQNIVDLLFLVGWILILNITVALSGVFADERSCRTDAMILSAKNGRGPVLRAKLLAAITAALGEALVLLGGCVLMIVIFYGSFGWNAAIQNVISNSPWNITVGQMLLLYFALAAVVSIFFAVTNLFLSQLTGSAVATLAIHAAIVFLGLFNVPKSMGWLAKLWQLRPTMALYYGSFCNTYRYAGLDGVTLSLILYPALALLLARLLGISYRRSQVESR